MPREVVTPDEIWNLAVALRTLQMELKSLNDDLLSKKRALSDLWPDEQGENFRNIIDDISNLNVEADLEVTEQLKKLKAYHENLTQAVALGQNH